MRGKKLLLWSLVVVIGGIGGAMLFPQLRGKTIVEAEPTAGDKKNTMESPDRLYRIKRGELVIGIRQTGFVNAQKKHKMAFEGGVNTKLLWIIDENKKVKKGDVLAKFETDDLTDRIDEFRLEVDNLEKELTIAHENKKILASNNRSMIRSAEDKVTMAEDNLKQYRNFERGKKRDTLDLTLQKNEKAYEEASSNYLKRKNEIDAKGATNVDDAKKAEIELNNLKQKMDDAYNEVGNATLEIKVFKRYTNPNKFTELTNQLEQAKLELEKAKIQAASEVLQRDKEITSLVVKLKKKKDQLEKHESYVSMMQLVSPVEGVVVYGDPDRRWGNPEIKLGMDIRRMQVLLTIPDMSRLVVEFDLPEQYRSRVKLGDRVIITPEAIRQVTVPGEISAIDSLPVNQIFWDRNSPKIYKSTISLKNQDARLVCGMSVQIEIITKVIADTLFVPIEAVFEESGKYYVYLKAGFKARRQLVKIGQSNDNYVQILEGVDDGDVVYLYKPFQRKSESE